MAPTFRHALPTFGVDTSTSFKSARWGEHCPVVECPRSSRIWIHTCSAVLVHELLCVYVFGLLLWFALFNISWLLTRCHWYKQLLVTARSSHWPWRLFWLVVSNTLLPALYTRAYFHFDSLGSIFSRLYLNLSGAFIWLSSCVSTLQARYRIHMALILCFNFTSEVYHLYCPRMPSLRRSLIWLVKSVSHDVMWWHDPIYHNQRLTIRMVLSLAQHTVPDLPRSTWCISNSLASLVSSDKKYVNL